MALIAGLSLSLSPAASQAFNQAELCEPSKEDATKAASTLTIAALVRDRGRFLTFELRPEHIEALRHFRDQS